MARIIKRYENRKLYDTSDKRYVSLEDVARLVREGEEVQILDNAGGADITAQTLAKAVLESEAEPGGRQLLHSQFMHDLLRYGNRFVSGGVESLQQGLDRLVEASLQRMGPVRETREELGRLRERLERLEGLIERLTEEEHDGNDTDGSTHGSAG